MEGKLLRARESWRQPPNDPETMANYHGDFALLQQKRVQSAAIKSQILKLLYEQEQRRIEKEKAKPHDPDAVAEFDDKRALKRYQAKRLAMSEPDIREIERKLNRDMRMSKDLPRYARGTHAPTMGTIQLDWISSSGKPLTEHEATMVAAHEQGHQFRHYNDEWFNEYFRSGFDLSKEVFTQEDYEKFIDDFHARQTGAETREEVKADWSYDMVKEMHVLGIFNAIEIAERMAQLKNYFGMSGNEEFTARHLEVARERFLKDLPGCDNGMTRFFRAITPETEERFLYLINNSGI